MLATSLLRIAAVSVLLPTVVGPLDARQTTAQDIPSSEGARYAWITSAWVGVSIDSRGPFSGVRERSLIEVGVAFERPLLVGRRFQIRYALAIAPLVFLPNNSGGVATRVVNDTVLVRSPRTRPTIGSGLLPLGVRFVVRLAEGVTVKSGAGGGVLLFNHAVPFDNTGRFHFYADALVSSTVTLSDRFAIGAGYRYQHISNAYLVDVNPGLDANVFFIELSHRAW